MHVQVDPRRNELIAMAPAGAPRLVTGAAAAATPFRCLPKKAKILAQPSIAGCCRYSGAW